MAAFRPSDTLYPFVGKTVDLVGWLRQAYPSEERHVV